MRIFIGRDYYDIGLSSGHDDALVFQRREDWILSDQEVEAVGFPSRRSMKLSLRSWHDKSGITHTDDPFVMNRVSYHVYPVVVGFCGKLYYAFATVIGDAAPVVQWTEADFVHWLDDQEIEVVTARWHNTTTVKSYYGQTITPAIYHWMVASRITTLSYIGEYPSSVWHVNAPNLKDAQFAKVFDPYMAFQEIALWVGGILSGTENPIVQITDDLVKIEKHGFDKKLSFRKAKSTGR